MVKELYKEYQYENTGSSIKIYIPKYQKNKLKECRTLNSLFMVVGLISEEDCCIRMAPWQMFNHYVNLTTVELPSAEFPSRPVRIITNEEAEFMIEEIDLRLNPVGFYK